MCSKQKLCITCVHNVVIIIPFLVCEEEHGAVQHIGDVGRLHRFSKENLKIHMGAWGPLPPLPSPPLPSPPCPPSYIPLPLEVGPLKSS